MRFSTMCLSLEYSMSVKLLTEQCLEFLSLKGGCTGMSEAMLVKCHIVGNQGHGSFLPTHKILVLIT